MKTITIILITLTVVSNIEAADNPLPENAAKLRDSYQEAVATATRPLTERYVRELEKLKDAAAKSGKLEDAILIQAELESAKGESESDLIAPFLGQWFFDSFSLEILPNNIVRSNVAGGTWKIQDRNLVITFDNNFSHVYPLKQSGKDIEGTEIKPNGDKGMKLKYVRRRL